MRTGAALDVEVVAQADGLARCVQFFKQAWIKFR